MVESSSGKQVAKRPQKEATYVEKKEKTLKKIVMGKEAKGFDPVECRMKDATIGKEYAKLFPLGFAPVKDVKLPIN
jgi:hypothetical protein